ncbi:MAG: chitobiase/beta-hexosaminidase C-terminal domain-containing protein [Candidatus Syntrophosphaera sp.]
MYEEGSVIVSGPTNAAPNGLLRKVAGHSVQGEQIVVTTERATLEDVFDQTEIHFERELKTTDIASTRILEDGIEFLRDGDNPVEFNYHIEKDFNLPDNVTVTLSGDISLEMGYDLNVRIRLMEGLDHVLSTAYVNQESELAMTVSEGFSLEEEVTLIEHDFLPITIPVLGIPVSFTPKVAILLEINASGEAAITTSVSTTSDIRVGLQYNKPEWSQTTQTDMDFDFSPPDIGELDVNINAFAGAGPRFDLMLYDSVGPFIKCIGYLDFEASIDADPWWILYGGFSADAGVEFDAIGYEFDYTVEDVVDYKSILGQASSDQTVEAPTFEPPAGSYDSEVEVFLHCATNGAEIRFTTDGSLPTEASSLYSDPISITSTTTIKARAYLDLEDWLPSPVSSATYDMDGQPTVATPTFYPPGGTYDLPQSIIINCATSGSLFSAAADCYSLYSSAQQFFVAG